MEASLPFRRRHGNARSNISMPPRFFCLMMTAGQDLRSQGVETLIITKFSWLADQRDIHNRPVIPPHQVQVGVGVSSLRHPLLVDGRSNAWRLLES